MYTVHMIVTENYTSQDFFANLSEAVQFCEASAHPAWVKDQNNLTVHISF